MSDYMPIQPDYGTASNAAVTFTYAADIGTRHLIFKVDSSYSGTPSSGSMTITSGGKTRYSVDIASSGPQFDVFRTPFTGGYGEAVAVTLSAGGSGVVGKLNVFHASG